MVKPKQNIPNIPARDSMASNSLCDMEGAPYISGLQSDAVNSMVSSSGQVCQRSTFVL